MKYTFKDITNKEMYDTAMVLMIAGQYNIFNNIVLDKLKDKCKSEDTYKVDTGLFAEFGVDSNSTDNNIVASNSVDFTTFMDVVDMPSINGKWFCSVDLSLMKDKQIEKLNNYIKNPSKNGVLVIVSHDFKDFRPYLNNKAFILGMNSHLIQLGFPSRSVLVPLVVDLFKKRTVTIDTQSAELFVMRMSSAYDDYDSVIDKICLGYSNSSISYDQVKLGLKGIDNYVLDDFIERMLSPIETDDIKTNRRIYNMLGALLGEMGAMELVKQIKYKVDDFIEFRVAINSGIIPIKVRYSVEEAKKKLGETSKIAKIVDFRFRKMAYTASLTSLKDWTYIKLILNNVRYRNNVLECEKVLYTLVHRAVLSQSRLNNSLGIENIMDNEISRINQITYDESHLMLSPKQLSEGDEISEQS